MRLSSSAALATLLLALARPAIAEPPSISHEPIVRKVAPAIVAIEAHSKKNGRAMSWFGTGTIISEDGAVLTSTTVCPSDATKVWVRFPGGKRIEAKFVAGSDALEVAVLRLPEGKYDHVTMGNSKALKLGHVVYTFGNCQHSMEIDDQVAVAQGEVSGFYKLTDTFEGKEYYEWCTYKGDVIETTAPLNPGVDGGPLIDAYGRLVGIMSLSYNETRWLGVAVPQQVWNEQVSKWLKGDLEVVKLPVVKEPKPDPDPTPEVPAVDEDAGWLGLTFDSDEPLVDTVARNSPAMKAGMQRDDRILKVAGKEIETPADVVKALKGKKPGDTVELTIERAGKQHVLKVKLGYQPM